jgi:hypothetical protein
MTRKPKKRMPPDAVTGLPRDQATPMVSLKVKPKKTSRGKASDRHAIGPHAEPGLESRVGRLARNGRRVSLYSWAALFFVSFAVLLGITTMSVVRYRPRRAG